MLDELKPLGLTDVATRLGIDPFEVVTLLVRGGVMPEALRLTEDHVEKVAHYAGIETWWPVAVQPDDANPRRALVRCAVGQLIERGCVGEKTTRLDNLWRGLDDEEAALIQAAVSAMTEAEILVTSRDATGYRVAVSAEAHEIAVRLASIGDAPVAVATVWAE